MRTDTGLSAFLFFSGSSHSADVGDDGSPLGVSARRFLFFRRYGLPSCGL